MEISTVTVTDVVRNFSEIMNQVKYQHKSFLIKKGSSIVAKITPEENYLSTSISSLNYFFAQAPKLEDDIDSFKQDIFSLKNNLENEGSKWD